MEVQSVPAEDSAEEFRRVHHVNSNITIHLKYIALGPAGASNVVVHTSTFVAKGWA